MRCMGKNEPKSGAGFSLQMWLVRFLGKKKKSGGEEEDGLCYKTSVLCSLLTHSKKGKILKETKKLALLEARLKECKEPNSPSGRGSSVTRSVTECLKEEIP